MVPVVMVPPRGAATLAAAPPPFFILGCPRSGTTLIAQLLDSHSRMAVFVESMYYPLFRADLHRYGSLTRRGNRRRLIENFRSMVLLHGLHRIAPPSVDEIEAALPSPTFEGVFAAFLRLYAERQGKVRCGEKTASHHDYLPDIRMRMPESPVLFVMRDPRDVVFSIRRMFEGRLETAIAWWNQAFHSYQRAAESVHLLRYEELVRAPMPTLERVCVQLGEAYDPGMLDFFGRVPDRLRAAPHHRKLMQPIDPGSIGAYRQMSAEEIELIEAGCAAGMDAMGYERATRATGRSVVMPARRSRVRSAVERVRRFRKRPDLLRQGWTRWRMRAGVSLRYFLTLGPLRRSLGGAVSTVRAAQIPQGMNRPPGFVVRARRRLLQLLAPALAYDLKRRFWNRFWARPDSPSPRNFWFLPDAVIPRPVREAVADGWLVPGSTVIDIGCGDGRIPAYLVDTGFRSVGVDFAAGAIERARERFGESERLQYRVVDFCAESPGLPMFDAAVDRGCYHGLPERMRPAYARNLIASTRPGTRFLLMVKVSGETDSDASTVARRVDRMTAELRGRFGAAFRIERIEAVVYNSRGDDDPRESLPGLAVRMTRFA